MMYNEKQLVSFGNHLLERYGVMVFSADGKNTPLYQRQVAHADFCNWLDKNPVENAPKQLPSTFQHGDLVLFRLTENMPYIPARVHAVHFYNEQVKYDLTIKASENKEDLTRIYNVASSFVSAHE